MAPAQPESALPPFTPVSTYVPPTLDPTRWSELEPLYAGLLGRQVTSAAGLVELILDRSELDAAASEAASTNHINMTRDTENAEVKRRYLDFVENVEPRLKEVGFELDKKVASSPFAGELDPARFGVLLRDTKAAVELFRPENIPLETDLTKLNQRYDEICGAMMVNFRSQERTLPQMGRYQEEPDRATREEAWRLVVERRLRDREAIEGIFEEMLAKRHTVARNAGFDDYRGYAFKAKRRFDYTPKDCDLFAQGVEKHVVPAMRRLHAQRRAGLGLERLRPWDLAVDPKGRPALRPFATADEMVVRTRRVFSRMDSSPGGLAALFGALADGPQGEACLDLDSRKGKAPGGYQANRDRRRLPFIFMNAAGVQRDVETMVHEAGHAFHSLLCRGENVLSNRADIPLEFAEVASMSMELTSHPFLDEFYPNAGDADRARRVHLEGIATILPWIATIDQFQQWLYTHPGHTRDERAAVWVGLQERFGADVDWSGLEEARRFMWQRQLHLFGAPFYYIEYGIAQLGALQLWQRYRSDAPGAIAAYKRGLALGGSRPLPQLFEAAGLDFDFSPARIERTWGEVERALEELPV
ncbi:MAG: M3 family oligoendopeptidase [Phycisphaerales bacterium]